MAKTSYFAVAGLITRPPSRWSAALAEQPHRGVLTPVSAIPKARPHKTQSLLPRRFDSWLRRRRNACPYLLPTAAIKDRVPLRRPWGPFPPDLAVQGATYQFGEAQLLASRLIAQEPLDVSRETERHRHTAFWQFRSGHKVMCIIVSYTMSRLNFLAPVYSL